MISHNPYLLEVREDEPGWEARLAAAGERYREACRRAGVELPSPDEVISFVTTGGTMTCPPWVRVHCIWTHSPRVREEFEALGAG